jgi:hypothetical protein
MSRHDAMDALTGFGVLLALTLAVAAWIHTFTEWESTWRANWPLMRGRLLGVR